MGDEYLLFLANKIDEEIARMSESLIAGAAADYAQYRYSCGVVHGLLMAKNNIVELAERMEHEDD